ncbi:MAG: hypothetical protein QNK37_20200 [Acidobacteriota bacterium]|nr:hypothetical protein [Acidobacteriota bacterium]
MSKAGTKAASSTQPKVDIAEAVTKTATAGGDALTDAVVAETQAIRQEAEKVQASGEEAAKVAAHIEKTAAAS